MRFASIYSAAVWAVLYVTPVQAGVIGAYTLDAQSSSADIFEDAVFKHATPREVADEPPYVRGFMKRAAFHSPKNWRFFDEPPLYHAASPAQAVNMTIEAPDTTGHPRVQDAVFYSQGDNKASPPKHAAKSLACMARNVYYEARGEGAAAMVAVGAVALNRVRTEGVTPCDVVYARAHGTCQFSWTCMHLSEPGGDDWARALAVASALLSPGGLPDPSRGATYFARCGRHIGVSGLIKTTRIGAHCFWRTDDTVAETGKAPTYQLAEDPSQRYGWALIVDGHDDNFLQTADDSVQPNDR